MPDIVLLMIGTNDFLFQGASGEALANELEELVESLLSVAVDLFVATIPPIDVKGSLPREHSHSKLKEVHQTTLNKQIKIYNGRIPDLAAKHPNVHFVDVNRRFELNKKSESEDLGDGVHPQDMSAYEKISNAWCDAIFYLFHTQPRKDGDLNRDESVNWTDLSILLKARNKSFPFLVNGRRPRNGPRDLDGDGTITVLDALKLAFK